MPTRSSPLAAASITVTVLASSSAPTPLYGTYAQHWGFSATTTTVVFGVYALAVLASLLVLGRLSDHLGRRPVLAGALAVQIVAMLVLATAPGVPGLIAGRVLQGLSTGAAVGAAGGLALDVDPRRGAVVNSVAPPVGTAAGALLAAAVVGFLPWPTHLVYLVLLAVYVVQLVAVLRSPETVPLRPDRLQEARASLVPRVAVPAELRGAFAAGAPIVFAVWALAGFYGSLAPAVVRAAFGWGSPVAGSATLFLQTAVAAVCVLLLRTTAARTCVLVAAAALTVGMALTVTALSAGPPGLARALFFTGTAVAGVGFGAGFQGGIRTVVPRARPGQRAGVLSSLYVAAYLGLGLPAVLAGALSVHDGLLPTTREYAVAVVVLALLAATATVLPGRRETPSPCTPGTPETPGGTP
ncbi:MFS transporter [Kineococcus sp. SYSU DK001]|uniref:MFS transporter n=1 Tax=Kineococcus sp. SYSU DK001 TaxID=3383122 RepID=UPI003D7D491A